jgi:hypothetical protein
VEITACKLKFFLNPIIDFRNQEIRQCRKGEINNLTSAIVSQLRHKQTCQYAIPSMNISPAWAILQFPVVNCVSPASAFQHQGQFQGMKRRKYNRSKEHIWVDGEKY